MQNHSKLFPVSGGVPHLELRPGSSLESLYIRVCVHVCMCVCVCVCMCWEWGLAEVRHGREIVLKESPQTYVGTIRRMGFLKGFGDHIAPLLGKPVRDMTQLAACLCPEDRLQPPCFRGREWNATEYPERLSQGKRKKKKN